MEVLLFFQIFKYQNQGKFFLDDILVNDVDDVDEDNNGSDFTDFS